jgi:hypothetical protein
LGVIPACGDWQGSQKWVWVVDRDIAMNEIGNSLSGIRAVFQKILENFSNE